MTNSKKDKKQDKPVKKTWFKLMTWEFKRRDKKYPPINKIKKTKIKEGDFVLDYGCGPGSYTIAAAEVVGTSGSVFAVDIHPLAIKEVKKRAAEKGIKNIETILSDCDTRLEEKSIDAVLLLDIFHDLSDQEKILKELHRVLKKNGWLTVDDHHLEENEIIKEITYKGLFKFVEKKDEVYNFIKI